jgi:hypothetical protein
MFCQTSEPAPQLGLEFALWGPTASLVLTLLSMKYIIPTQIPSFHSLKPLAINICFTFSFVWIFPLTDKMYRGTLLALLPSLTLAAVVLPRDTNENQVEHRPTTTYAGTCTCKKHRSLCSQLWKYPCSSPSCPPKTPKSALLIIVLAVFLYKTLRDVMLTLR